MLVIAFTEFEIKTALLSLFSIRFDNENLLITVECVANGGWSHRSRLAPLIRRVHTTH